MTESFGNLDPTIDSVVGLDAALALTTTGPLPGPTLVIAGASASSADLRHAGQDAVIARSVEDFRSVQFIEVKHCVVTPDGFSLALELIRSSVLDPGSIIVWSLGLPLLGSLERLSSVGLPEDVTVCRISGDMEDAVVITSRGSYQKLEFNSFRAGLTVGANLARNWGHDDDPVAAADTKAALALLQQKLLSVLETMWPTDADKHKARVVGADSPSADTVRSAGYARLENDLILLKRRYDALDRKYTALSSSRLGALTLRRWANKNPRQNKDIPAKDGLK